MYSRYPGRSDRPIRLPEHYSGCAFSPPRPAKAAEEPPIPVSFSPAREPSAQEPKREREHGSHPAAPRSEIPVSVPSQPSSADGEKETEPASDAAEKEREAPPDLPTAALAEAAVPASKHAKDGHESGLPFGLGSLFGGKFPAFPGGMSFDELLIIGLILLLSHSEQDSDIILWLALLLFCK